MKYLKKLTYYLHGGIFAAVASMLLYITFQDATIFTPPSSIWRATIASVLLYALLAVVLYVATRDHDTSGLTSTFFILGLFYLWKPFLFALFVIIATWALLALVARRFFLWQLHASAITVSLVFLIYFGSSYINFIIRTPVDEKENLTSRIDIQFTEDPQLKPDIYYVILDSYGGADMLQSVHGFDNSKFISDLEERGFVIPKGSRANYPRTILSLSSSLNMQYLDTVSSKLEDSYLWWPLVGTFSDNQVKSNLIEQGYQTVSFASGWDFTSLEDSDYYAQPYPVFLNKFEELYFQSTNLSMFEFLNKYGVSTPSYDTHRQTTAFEFEELGRASKLSSPKFVFVHFIVPHAPFVFDAKGNPVTPDYPFTFSDNPHLLSSNTEYRAGYLAQLSFVNNEVIRAVDNILLNSKTPPIIILQGDHGPGVYFDYNSSENSCLYERFSILNAYYLPGLSGKMPEDISPVNTFRFIFNEYFNTDLELLPNRHYFSIFRAMYQFEDVTTKINQPCQIQ